MMAPSSISSSDHTTLPMSTLNKTLASSKHFEIVFNSRTKHRPNIMEESSTNSTEIEDDDLKEDEQNGYVRMQQHPHRVTRIPSHADHFRESGRYQGDQYTYSDDGTNDSRLNLASPNFLAFGNGTNSLFAPVPYTSTSSKPVPHPSSLNAQPNTPGVVHSRLHEGTQSNRSSSSSSFSSSFLELEPNQSKKALNALKNGNSMEPIALDHNPRKNSIEMFLSQSPSQALGSHFLKLNLKDEEAHSSTPATNSDTNTIHIARASASTPESSIYLPPVFSLDGNTSHSRIRPDFNPHPSHLPSTHPPQVDPQSVSIDPINEWNESSPSDVRLVHYDPNYESIQYSRPLDHEYSSTIEGYPFPMVPYNLNRNHFPPPFAPVPPTFARSFQENYDLNAMSFPMGIRPNVSVLTDSYRRIPLPAFNALPHPSMIHLNRLPSCNLKFCKFYLQGHCRLGSKCRYAHGPTPPMYPMPSHVPLPSCVVSETPGMYPNTLEESIEMYPKTLRKNSNGISNVAQRSGALTTLSISEEDIKGRVYSMSKDQNGCRLLQEQLEYDDRKTLWQIIFQESLHHLPEMMVDPFGNYLFQKLIARADEWQRLAIVRAVCPHLMAAALNLHGTRSVQKVVEICAISQSEKKDATSIDLPQLIVHALKDDAVRLCIDSNGNHVIQRALQYFNPKFTQFIFDAVSRECTTVGTHRHGCCVLQRCLDAANVTQKKELIAQVEYHAMKLMQDPYGNYVVQYVLDACTAEEAIGIMMKPLGHVFELSIQKFSSNVVEKCLEKAPERIRRRYVEELIVCAKMQRLLQDQFANYVVQRALCVCAESQCMALVAAICPHLSAMKNSSNGRRISARIEKRFPQMDLEMAMESGRMDREDDNLCGGTLEHLREFVN
uniref:Uncharacterized protein AlNc14C140G7225 n=1 Tax=Albugo laibachii Nc14 TaxID=890382 RepID=F0WL38_9STRA|nr:conserved hypothetical protein [Albugo laibachii Nc14]|eukprot:CCA21998.1 conserved hypothetical protein [Albugo laibachii Nc14]